ncbi:sensor histidine kinase N-terminal domain-containing protein [Ramlibacter sp. USB13]|uniref:histidine kinase n=1 Tax=Ramlibacter cellulosilyticus TaxID=2764187 RepID=A0A923MTJ0_9BURK|nr:sensor histidine kinase [Ramlibacter cellulosilyticus]MBC5784711.1 sensor histidine kinase N-terminal domain-containing protein [Ramlibacter cellulosilyticus]
MRWKRPSRLRLAQQLLLLLLPMLVLLSLAELRLTAQDVRRAADAAYDRSLLGALKSIDANVSTESGGLAVELPYRLFEFFELTASGPVQYRVATADGLVELGSPDLPAPPRSLQLGVPQFYDGTYFGSPVRIAAYARELEKPAHGSASRQVVIQVAEGTQSRDEFRRTFVRRAAWSNAAFLVLATSACIVAVVFVLRPLGRLSREVAQRSPGELQPLADGNLPGDVRPLVDAINQHMQRTHALGAQQRMFLDDASHQLRTHLTTLRMQVDFALREHDPREVRATLAALGEELQRATRSTNQLLSFARSEAVDLHLAFFDARELLQEVARQFLPTARAKGLDLGVEAEALQARGDAALLREALVNLVANAVGYVPEGSITLRAAEDASGWSLSVEDTGPGLPAELQGRAGSRFARGQGGRAGGSGLGLAIAGAIAARHAGTLRLEAGADGRGLVATLRWPRASTVREN